MMHNINIIYQNDMSIFMRLQSRIPYPVFESVPVIRFIYYYRTVRRTKNKLHFHVI